jgi:hypothetical protein
VLGSADLGGETTLSDKNRSVNSETVEDWKKY